jgi:rhodanese-related sulfurtransferase
MRSLQVAQYLESLGFTSVYNLSGGIAAWADQVEPAMPRY